MTDYNRYIKSEKNEHWIEEPIFSKSDFIEKIKIRFSDRMDRRLKGNKSDERVIEFLKEEIEQIEKANRSLPIPDYSKLSFAQKVTGDLGLSDETIEEFKEFLKSYSRYKNSEFEKEYLKNRLDEITKKDSKPKILENQFDRVFKNDIGFTVFTKMFELYKTETTHLANFSFLFYAMEKEFLVCSQIQFVELLRDEKYNIEIDKIDSRQSGKSKKQTLYNSIKEKYQLPIIKAQ